jgi:hypothetical protein
MKNTQPLQIILIDDKQYYLFNELKLLDQLFFKYILNATSQEVIDYFHLPENDYTFAYYKNKDWIKSGKHFQKSLLLLSREWSENNVEYFLNIKQQIKDKERESIRQQYSGTFLDDVNIFDEECTGTHDFIPEHPEPHSKY